MNPETILKHLVTRESELERKRTRSLARQMWGDVIDTEARIDECEHLRKWLAEQETGQQKAWIGQSQEVPTTAIGKLS